MKTDLAKRDMTKYCDFHRDHEHRTYDCIQLKKEIEFQIRRGHLRRYMAPEDRNRAPPSPPRQPAPAQHQQPLGEINVISGGFASGRESSSTRKAHLRSFISGETLEVQAVSMLPQLDTTITFSDADLEGCQHPHDDPLVIRVVVANKTIHKVLINNGSSANIIFTSAFDKMGIGREKSKPVNAHLRGLSEERVLPLGSVQPVLTLGDPPYQAKTMTKFLIVEAPSAYNMLLGRPSLNSIRVIPSAYHMVVKFPTENGVGKARGDQQISRECYLVSMKQKAVESVHADELDMRDELNTQLTPSEELEPVQLDNQSEHLTHIRSKLAEDDRDLLIHFLKQNVEVFAWKQEDMGGIDQAVITHKLNVSPSFKPVKQKRQSFSPKRQKAINEEVSKLLQARAIREVNYPDWLANVVLVKKENGKWRLYIDFTDVN